MKEKIFHGKNFIKGEVTAKDYKPGGMSDQEWHNVLIAATAGDAEAVQTCVDAGMHPLGIESAAILEFRRTYRQIHREEPGV